MLGTMEPKERKKERKKEKKKKFALKLLAVLTPSRCYHLMRGVSICQLVSRSADNKTCAERERLLIYFEFLRSAFKFISQSFFLHATKN